MPAHDDDQTTAAMPQPPGPAIPLDLADPVDVLSWLPYGLGFRPEESVVLIAVHHDDDQIRLGLLARFDLRDLGLAEVRRNVEAHLCAERATQVLCVIVSEEPWEQTLALMRPAGRVLEWWLTRPWSDPCATWLMSRKAFRCLECARPGCCPEHGRAASALAHSATTASLVYQGRSYVEDRRDLTAQADLVADGRRAASAAAVRHWRRREQTRDREGLQAWRTGCLERWTVLVQRAASGSAAEPPPEPALLGEVLAGLSDTWVRDGVMLAAAAGRVLDPGERDGVLAELFVGDVQPVEEHQRPARQALMCLASHATRRWRVAPLATASWLAWWSGDGASAGQLLDRACALDADYSLAHLLRTILAAGVAPGWVRAAAPPQHPYGRDQELLD
ncbi:DUF4192 domain-containing protein [Ruania suaedae]|uniref:DUF4192 domain-containing protein n=1 Tax=Ruania suaedae TaxID=2897774 RepID=UPI001E576043|nr:DUF4192 domain-containing protein [Ruania suaedae]UFU01627.1 DUF4192 domain-containing protein [Ruania suaedae]